MYNMLSEYRIWCNECMPLCIYMLYRQCYVNLLQLLLLLLSHCAMTFSTPPNWFFIGVSICVQACPGDVFLASIWSPGTGRPHALICVGPAIARPWIHHDLLSAHAQGCGVPGSAIRASLFPVSAALMASDVIALTDAMALDVNAPGERAIGLPFTSFADTSRLLEVCSPIWCAYPTRPHCPVLSALWLGDPTPFWAGLSPNQLAHNYVKCRLVCYTPCIFSSEQTSFEPVSTE